MQNTPRKINILGLFICLVLVGSSYYFEYIKGLQPCLLCLTQRWSLMFLGVILLAAVLQNPKKLGIRIYAVITFLIAALGLYAASRQTWLQHLPIDENAACLPGLNYLLQTCPLPHVAKLMLQGSPECGRVTWEFMGFTMAECSLVFFVVFVILGLAQFLLSFRAIKS